MKGLRCAVVLGVTALAASACGGGQRAGSTVVTLGGPLKERVSAETVSSSRLILGGRVRCTAMNPRSVQAGEPLGLRFAVRNVSAQPVKVPLGRGNLWVVVRAADGTTYDTRVPLQSEIGPMVIPTTLPPGRTKTVSYVGKYLRVRWRGPLRVTPGCEQTPLAALPVGVTSPGPPADENTAVADVVAASGHLLDHCRPERAGIAVQGQIDPPSGNTPPMQATCSVTLEDKGDFLVAQAIIVSPPELGSVDTGQPYEQLSVHHAAPYEAVAWQFVVTKDGATPVAAAEADATKAANRMYPDWSWTSSGVQRLGSGRSRCGGSGGGFGGVGPTVEFVSACPS